MSSSPSITTDPGTEGAPGFKTETCRRAFEAWQAQHKTLLTPHDRQVDTPDGLAGEWNVIEWLDQAGAFVLTTGPSSEVGSETPAEIDDAYSGLIHPTTESAFAAYRKALTSQTPHLTFRTHHEWRGEFIAVERLLLPLMDADGGCTRLLVAVERIKVGADDRPPFVDSGIWLSATPPVNA